MDGIKFYMTHHTIPEELQGRVKKWAEYSWNRFVCNQNCSKTFLIIAKTKRQNLQQNCSTVPLYSICRTQAMDDHHMLDILPFRLRAEIAKHIHLETLQKVSTHLLLVYELSTLCRLALLPVGNNANNLCICLKVNFVYVPRYDILLGWGVWCK